MKSIFFCKAYYGHNMKPGKIKKSYKKTVKLCKIGMRQVNFRKYL